MILRALGFTWMLAIAGGAGGCNDDPLPSETTTAPLPDLAPAPTGNVRIEFSGAAGSGVHGDASGVSVPLPTPTARPLDSLDYSFFFAVAGRYVLGVDWRDKTDGNQGWTASLGSDPGAPDWPVTTFPVTVDGTENPDLGFPNNGLGPVEVVLVGVAGARPNVLVVTARSVDNPTTDFGVFYQPVAGD